MEARNLATYAEIATRLAGMDKALALVQDIHGDQFSSVPDMIEVRIANLRGLQDEKFASIEKQFLERDTRVRESATATATAVQAALQAAKEAVGEQNKSFTLSIDKSEKATTEQITQQRVQMDTIASGILGTLSDLKERLTRMEATGIGHSGAVMESRAHAADSRGSTGLVIQIVLAGISILSFGGLILAILVGR